MRTDDEEDFLLGGCGGGGGSSPQRITKNNAHQHFSGGGLELPAQLLLPPSIRTMEPQYTAAPEYEELRHRYQLEVQQEINLCRRIMEEQQHQLLSESEYRNNLQRLNDIREFQAQQDQRQGLGHFLARELDRYHEQQQQQLQREQLQSQQARDNTLMAFLREEFLFQQRQQHVKQQQQLQEHLSQESRQHEQEQLLATLQACGNLSGILPAGIASLVSSLRPSESEMLARHHPSTTSPMRRIAILPSPESSQAYVEHFLENSNRQLSDFFPGFQDASDQTEVNSTNASSQGEFIEIDGKRNDNPHTPQDPPQSPQAKTNLSSYSLKIALAPSNGIESESLKNIIEHGGSDQVGEVPRQQLKSDQPIKTKTKVALNRSGMKNKKDQLVASKGVNEKKSSINAGEIDTKTHGTDENKLSIRERSTMEISGSERSPSTDVNGAEDQPETTKVSLAKEARKRKYDKAADIVLNFQRSSVSESEVQIAKTWGRNGNPSFHPENITFISPGVKFNLPSLPIEPELSEPEMADMSLVDHDHSDVDFTAEKKTRISTLLTSQPFPPLDNTGGHLQCRPLKPKRPGKDSWWPSNDSIRKERQQLNITPFDEDADAEIDTIEDSEIGVSLVRAGVKAAEQRLSHSKEPGVLEKLPHCKLYDDFCTEKKQDNFTPLFCCQTTEIFPYDVMVCCSVCSTWRHAQCGGHYKHYTAECVDSSCKEFVPLCDQCFIEKPLLKNNQSGSRRIEQQRIDNLRRCNATNAVMRQFTFAKHSGQCKWPLGSVPISHFSGHIRNVQARHEKAEKQWREMTSRLGNGNNSKPIERQRARTKELERLLACIEDAEGVMDRHNMMLFLQNDTSTIHPVGFESPRRNIFDPEDDPIYIDSFDASAERKLTKKSANSMRESQLVVTDLAAKSTVISDMKPCGGSDNVKLLANQRQNCIRQGCNRKSRFDSIFCSDSCGVSTLEADLLKTLKYASKLHPHALRS